MTYFLFALLLLFTNAVNTRKSFQDVWNARLLDVTSSSPTSSPTSVSLLSTSPSSSPSSSPSQYPTSAPSYGPTPGPTRVTTQGPTSHISSSPTSINVKSTSGPTYFPTISTKPVVSVSQYLTGVTCAVMKSSSGQEVFVSTVSKTVNVNVADIMITNTTCVGQMHAQSLSHSHFQIKSSSPYILIDYSITPTVSDVSYCQTIVQILQTAVTSGTFISTLISTASASNVNGFTNAQTSIASIDIPGAPSFPPSSAPQQSSSGAFFSNQTSVGVTFAFVGLAVVLIILITAYWFRKREEATSPRQISMKKVIALDEPVNPTDATQESVDEKPTSYVYSARSALVRVFSNQFSSSKSASAPASSAAASDNSINNVKPSVLQSFAGLFSSSKPSSTAPDKKLSSSIELKTATKKTADVEAPTTVDTKKSYYDYYQDAVVTSADAEKPISAPRPSSVLAQASASMQLSLSTEYSQNSANTASQAPPEYCSEVIYSSNALSLKPDADIASPSVALSEPTTEQDDITGESTTEPQSPTPRQSMSKNRLTDSGRSEHFPSSDMGDLYPAKKKVF